LPQKIISPKSEKPYSGRVALLTLGWSDMEIDVKERLKEMIVEITENESLRGTMRDATDLINGVGLDSIQMVNFILMIEDEFSLEIDLESFNIDILKSIADFSTHIVELQEEKKVENLKKYK
jgi:acyl carrier protein